MTPKSLVLTAFILTLLSQAHGKNDGGKVGNKLDYAEPKCLERLASAMEREVSKIVRATSDIKNKDEKNAFVEDLGRIVVRVTKNSVQRNLSVQDAITVAVNGANLNPNLNLGDAVLPVVRAKLQHLCVQANCCYT